MKLKISLPNGTIVDAEGTQEEMKSLIEQVALAPHVCPPVLTPQIVPYPYPFPYQPAPWITPQPWVNPGQPWFGTITVTSNEINTGPNADLPTSTYTVSDTNCNCTNH